MFLSGLFCMIATGLAWIVIGAVTSFAARRGVEQCMIQFGSAVLVTMVSVPLCIGRPIPGDSFGIMVLLALAGALNYLCFIFLTRSMTHLHNALAWAVMQSAMIFPFLLGVLFFQVKATGTRVIGMAAVLLALVLITVNSVRTKNSGTATSAAGLLWSILALLCAGVSQICANLPSYLQTSASLSSVDKTLCMMSGTILIFLTVHGKKLCRKGNYQGTLIPALILSGILILVQYLFFFRGLDLLARVQAGSIGYPVAIGVCIGGFSLYSGIILKEKFQQVTVAALGLNLSGIVLLSL